jgi:hypothetical protein
MAASDGRDNTPRHSTKSGGTKKSGGGKRADATTGGGGAPRGRTRALAEPLRAVTQQALGTRSLAEAALLSQWASIVGADLASICWPRRLSFPKRTERRAGTLVLRVRPGQAPRVGHQEPMILERVNAYFGYQAAARLHLEQGALPAPKAAPTPPPAPPSEAERTAAARQVAHVADPDLRHALTRLAQNLQRTHRGSDEQA